MTLATQRPKARPAHTHRRTGQHQKQTKGFMQTYWPYLPLFMVFAIVLLAVAARTLGTTGVFMGVGSLTIGGLALLA